MHYFCSVPSSSCNVKRGASNDTIDKNGLAEWEHQSPGSAASEFPADDGTTMNPPLHEGDASSVATSLPFAEFLPPVPDASVVEARLTNNPGFSFHKLTLDVQFSQIRSEYIKLQQTTMDPRMYNFATSRMKMTRNRYADILANEQTLFPLCMGKKRAPYINANLVELDVPGTLVASQAPTQECIPDFLSTLYTERVPLVIMLTKTEENCLLKADCYWPDDAASAKDVYRFGTMKVWKVASDPYQWSPELGLVRRAFFVQRTDRSGPPHKVIQIQYTNWPDHGVPSTTTSFEVMLRMLPVYRDGGPIIVHCSAGIGRTGTFIAGYAAQILVDKGELRDGSIPEIVSKMRASRFGMVQRLEQYMLIYQIVLQYLGMDVEEFSRALDRKAQEFQAYLLARRASSESAGVDRKIPLSVPSGASAYGKKK